MPTKTTRPIKTTSLLLLALLLALLLFTIGCKSGGGAASTPVNLVGQPGAIAPTPIPAPGGIGDRRESGLVGVTLLSVRRMSELYGRTADTFVTGEADFIVLDLLLDYGGGLKASVCPGRLLNEAGQAFGSAPVEMQPPYWVGAALYPGDVYRAYATYSIPKATQGQLTWECYVGTAAPLRFNFAANGGDAGLRPALPALSGEGRAFEVGGVQVGVTGATREAHQQRPSGQWLTVEVTLANVSNQSPNGYRPGEFYVTDNAGFRYRRDPLASNQLQTRQLLPGDALRGNLVFDLEAAAAGLVLNYADDAGNVVRIGLD